MAPNFAVQLIGTNLDPTAQEFWPTYPAHQTHHPAHYPFLSPQPQPFLLLSLPQLTPPPPPQPLFLPPEIPPAANSPTRAVLLSAVPPEVSESCVRRDLEYFGDVRAVQMERVLEGVLTVHFYDSRAAHAALDSIRYRHIQHQNQLRIHYSNNFGIGPPPPPPPGPGTISGQAVWAHFTLPVTNAFPGGLNQGTIVVFNLDPNVSALTLKNIFQIFGQVKELRETPMKKQQRFIEFYDVRDAARALSEMNGKGINGRTVMIEYSRPGGHFNKFHNYSRNHNMSNININRHDNNNNMKPHSMYSPTPPRTPPVQHRALPFRNRRGSPRQHLNARRRRSSSGSDGSIEAAMSRLTLRFARNGIVAASNSNNEVNNVAKKGNDNSSGSGSGATKQKKVRPWKGRQKNYDPKYLIKEEAIIIDDNNSGGENIVSKDTRTTVMIKNIPNKYSQKLLLNMLDNHCIHCNEQIAGDDHQPLSSYDFVYLPIDFNNKCNVGYGFVNMTSPEATLRLYKAFHHQHWDVFNSRKICEVTYARVQGLEALQEHFKNSKFACENDEYLPVVFTPPRDGRSRISSPLPIVLSVAMDTPAIHHNPDMDS